ncbi:ABC transporter substrate-binding protein/permease [Ligilactobacillus sp. LYQ139]|uniref:ABC transporter substrate-binding protein/permease n=1 Tax=Ligilactobacillus sp. LYQ139 TaxID=3378800 RepID=UPI003852F534
MHKVIHKITMFLICIGLSLASLGIMVNGNNNRQPVKADATPQLLTRIKHRGKLIVGTSADYPPFEFKQGSKYEGIDIDIARDIANKIGVKLEIKNMDFDSLLVALETHKVDMVIAALNPTPQREKSVAFSKSYYTDGNDLLIRKNDKDKITGLKDLTSHSTVGVQTGSVQAELVKKQLPHVKTKGLTKLNSLVIALKTGKVNAVVMDEATAKAYVQNDHSLSCLHAGFTGQSPANAIAFPKGSASQSLISLANHEITQLKKKQTIDKHYAPHAVALMMSHKSKRHVWNYTNYFISGIEITLLITVISTGIGVVLGTLLALLRLGTNKILKWLSIAYIEFVRGTPLMVQVMFMYFGVGMLIKNLPALVAGIIAVALNSGAYVAEIIRSGIMAVDKGQTEAAVSLGMSRRQMYRYIILPQALRNIWPALGNEFVTLIKESSLVSVIGVGELMYQTQMVQAATYQGVLPLAVTMVIYFVITFTLTRLLNWGERRINHD